MWWNWKNLPLSSNADSEIENFTQNTLDTRCQIKSPMWPNRTWRLGGSIVQIIYPQIAKYDLPQIICTIYPPSNRPILSKISNAHNIMLCFTKVFSAKDQLELRQKHIDFKQLLFSALMCWLKIRECYCLWCYFWSNQSRKLQGH